MLLLKPGSNNQRSLRDFFFKLTKMSALKRQQDALVAALREWDSADALLKRSLSEAVALASRLPGLCDTAAYAALCVDAVQLRDVVLSKQVATLELALRSAHDEARCESVAGRRPVPAHAAKLSASSHERPTQLVALDRALLRLERAAEASRPEVAEDAVRARRDAQGLRNAALRSLREAVAGGEDPAAVLELLDVPVDA